MKRVLIHMISALFPTKQLRQKVRSKLTKQANECSKRNDNLNFFQNSIEISGQDNRIILLDKNGREHSVDSLIPGLKIKISGKNNRCIFHENIKIRGTIEIDSENAVIDIGKNVKGHIFVRAKYGEAQKLEIGHDTTMHGVQIILDETAQVKIGSHVLMSTDILLQASDGHSILDLNTGKPLNSIQQKLIIEDHVWVGTRVTLLKNSHIHKDSVLGACSLACKDYKESNVVICGNPAKIIKRGINWDHRSPMQLNDMKLLSFKQGEVKDAS